MSAIDSPEKARRASQSRYAQRLRRLEKGFVVADVVKQQGTLDPDFWYWEGLRQRKIENDIRAAWSERERMNKFDEKCRGVSK